MHKTNAFTSDISKEYFNLALEIFRKKLSNFVYTMPEFYIIELEKEGPRNEKAFHRTALEAAIKICLKYNLELSVKPWREIRIGGVVVADTLTIYGNHE